jgi:hypothetical protein
MKKATHLRGLFLIIVIVVAMAAAISVVMVTVMMMMAVMVLPVLVLIVVRGVIRRPRGRIVVHRRRAVIDRRLMVENAAADVAVVDHQPAADHRLRLGDAGAQQGTRQ